MAYSAHSGNHREDAFFARSARWFQASPGGIARRPGHYHQLFRKRAGDLLRGPFVHGLSAGRYAGSPQVGSPGCCLCAHPPARRAVVLENAPLNVEITFSARGADRFVHSGQFTGDKRMAGAQRLQDFSRVERHSCWRLQSSARPKRIVLVAELESRPHSNGKTAAREFLGAAAHYARRIYDRKLIGRRGH